MASDPDPTPGPTDHPDPDATQRDSAEPASPTPSAPSSPNRPRFGIPGSRALDLTLLDIPHRPGAPTLALHGGAGGRVTELSLEAQADYDAALEAAFRAGEDVLSAGGSALDAVCAAVASMEDCPLFNAGRGASLTTSETAELDASVMTGAGDAGAVAVSRHAKNPVRLARGVMERSDHVLLVDPPQELGEEWGLESAPADYFVTESRLAQLRRVMAERDEAPRHGTVGAVAIDADGHVAAATSTGGIVAQAVGRVGDTPLIGAGTYAWEERQDGTGRAVAISCTGEGEAFIRAVLAHDVAARVRFGGASLPDAVASAIGEDLTDAQQASGGLVAVGRDTVVVAHNSPAMFSAHRDGDRIVTRT